HPLKNMVDRGIFDSGCSGHMTGNKDQLEDFEEFNGGSVTFGGSKGYITDTPTPAKGFACLIAKATSDKSKLWHRRLGHINFKNLNKLVKGNLVRGIPSKGGWKLAQIKKLIDEELKEKIEYLMRRMERFVPMDIEKESRKIIGVELQIESSKKLKSNIREDVSVPKEKDKESVKREEEFKIKNPVLRYTKRKSLARKGLQKKPESAKSGTEEDVEAYMEERVDEPSSEEFPMGLILQGPALGKIVKWQIIKTRKRGAYQIIREDNTDVVYLNFQGLLNDLTRDDLKELYRLMMLKYGDNRPEEEFERVL
ncbi:ribonuclease H-like domain-containing protein, partial [Tanacetum coccineum]